MLGRVASHSVEGQSLSSKRSYDEAGCSGLRATRHNPRTYLSMVTCLGIDMDAGLGAKTSSPTHTHCEESSTVSSLFG